MSTTTHYRTTHYRTTHHRTAATRAALVTVALLLGAAIASPADAQRPATDRRTAVAAGPSAGPGDGHSDGHSDDIALVVAYRKAAAAQYLVDHWAELVANYAR